LGTSGVLRHVDVFSNREGKVVNIRDEIVARVDNLPPDMQEQVLQFLASLPTSVARGEAGAGLRRFSGFLDPISVEEMTRAIEDACEQVDAREW
jgi:hypothetical protein